MNLLLDFYYFQGFKTRKESTYLDRFLASFANLRPIAKWGRFIGLTFRHFHDFEKRQDRDKNCILVVILYNFRKALYKD